MPWTTCFYSYKGGTGRTALLARIAQEMLKKEQRVCCVDFDIEAPGFEVFFNKNELSEYNLLPTFLNQTFTPLLNEIRTKELAAISTKASEVNIRDIDDFQDNFLYSTGAEEFKGAIYNFIGDVLNPSNFHVLLIDNRTGLTTRAENLFYFANTIVFVFRPDLQNQMIIKERLLSYFNYLMRDMPKLERICVVLNLIPNFSDEATQKRLEQFLSESGIQEAVGSKKLTLFKIPFFKEVYYNEREIFSVNNPVFEMIARFLLP